MTILKELEATFGDTSYLNKELKVFSNIFDLFILKFLGHS